MYVANDKQRGDDDLAWYARQPDFESLLEVAVLCRTSEDKRHGHQRRLKETDLRAAHSVLSECDFQSCKTFDAIHKAIEDALEDIPGIGPLTVFDIACRIGAFKGVSPKKVYLHAGTRKGAQALGLGRGEETIEVKRLPEEFHRLSPRHAEDCLCIYKDHIKRIASRLAR